MKPTCKYCGDCATVVGMDACDDCWNEIVLGKIPPASNITKSRPYRNNGSVQSDYDSNSREAAVRHLEDCR